MVFTENELHCDIFALVFLFNRSLLGHASWHTFLRLILFIHCWHCSRTLCLWCLEISKSDSIYVSSMTFESMRGVIHFGR